MNKVVKITSIILIAMMLVMTLGNVCMASDYEKTITELTSKKDAPGQKDLLDLGGNIVSIITTVGIVVAVIVLLILGIKYMMGSASEKAEYKKTMIPYLVGALLIFGASAIARAVVSITSGVTGGK